MNTPPFLLGTAILFWGALGVHWIALAIAVAFEGARFVRWRLELTEAQQMRVADATTLLMLASGVMFYLATGFPRAAVLFFEWLPVILMPVALMQAYGTAAELDLRILFWSLRQRVTPEPRRANVGYPYLILWVVAASAAPEHGPAFDAGLALILVWALWPLRVRGRNVAAWIAMTCTAIVLGYMGGIALHGLQLWLEGAVPEWLAGGGSKINPYRGTTDIGRLGQLKMSDTIVLRVRPDYELKPPLLLHQASYNEYQSGNWIARGGTFTKLVPAAGTRNWKVGEGTATRTLAIVDPARTGDPVLALPQGSVTVLDFDVFALKRNPLGAVQAEAPPGFITYRVGFDPAVSDPDAPLPQETRLPAEERAVIERVAREWGLAGLAPRAAIETIRNHFRRDFAYSTFQEAPRGSATPLADFLLRTHTGHCEHFASATTMLLRAAGVPARYSSGYSVQEFSELEGAWIARERHSHAWARAYVDGKWLDVDSTPPIWFEIEAGRRPAWGVFTDAWSWGRYRLDRWMTESAISARAIAFGIPLVLALLFFARRALRSLRSAAVRIAPDRVDKSPDEAATSEFMQVVRHLEALGLARSPFETLREWMAREKARFPGDVEELARLAALHERFRFDPRGLDPAQLEDLETSSARWIDATPRG